jgi:hypothetical protein
MRLIPTFCIIVSLGLALSFLLPELIIHNPDNIVDGTVIHTNDDAIYVLQDGVVYIVETLPFSPIAEGDNVYYECGTLLKSPKQFALNKIKGDKSYVK